MLRLIVQLTAILLIIGGSWLALPRTAPLAQASESHTPQTATMTQTILSQVTLDVQTQLQPASEVETQLQALIRQHKLAPLSPVPAESAAKVELGRLLFFDKVLSGNRDTACATCHHPTEGSGDGLPVSIGTGGAGVGSARQLGEGRALVPRNAPELFNRGLPEWEVFFWDGRLSRRIGGGFNNPAGEMLPAELDTLLAAQAMFPVTSRDEMRGTMHDLDVHGQVNEVSFIDEADFTVMWDSLMHRVLSIPGYVALFQQVYPDVPVEALGFQHAANAIGAFEATSFTTHNSPWNRYLNGDSFALSESAKRGATLFYGEANCVSCHSGTLLTDQRHHNIGVPQVGPGKGAEAPYDFGLGRETRSQLDKFAFRTPSLHNVALTGPYMHNGAYRDLESAVRHHLNPAASLRTYDPTQQLPAALHPTVQSNEAFFTEMLLHLDPLLTPAPTLNDAEVADLLEFLHALTDPTTQETLDTLMPATVPSGLPVD